VVETNPGVEVEVISILEGEAVFAIKVFKVEITALVTISGDFHAWLWYYFEGRCITVIEFGSTELRKQCCELDLESLIAEDIIAVAEVVVLRENVTVIRSQRAFQNPTCPVIEVLFFAGD